MHYLKHKFFGSNTVGEKGQVVIPSQTREMMGIKPGERLVFFGNEKIVHMVRADQLDEVFETVTECLSEQVNIVKEKIKKDLKEV